MPWLTDRVKLLLLGILCASGAYLAFYLLQDWAFVLIVVVGAWSAYQKHKNTPKRGV